MATAKTSTTASESLRAIEMRLLDNLRRSPSGCWEWVAKTDKDGYGSWRVPGFAQQSHRIAYRLFCGDLTGARCVCHTCDNPRCCNPVHLFLGSDLDNARDRDRKGRGPRGERNHFAKITPEVVRRVRRMLAAGENQTQTARACGLSRGIVHNIAVGRAWVHVA